jgi:hypothetical protein
MSIDALVAVIELSAISSFLEHEYDYHVRFIARYLATSAFLKKGEEGGCLPLY